MTLTLPRHAAEITPEWLTQALRAGGAGDVTVTAAGVSRIGWDQGFTGGALFRIRPDYLVAGSGPPSLVAKLSPMDPVLAARFFAANAREVAFYDQMAGRAGLPVPHCHHAATDPLRQASVILLQDLGQGRSVPFATGLSAPDSAALVDALASVHAHWWQHPDLADIDGMALLGEFDFAGCWARYPARLVEILGDVTLPPAFVALVDHLVADQTRIFSDIYSKGPVTCLHRDPQADNVMFDAGGGAVLLDWQMIGKGRGASDVAYALISSCAPATRRSCERDLVQRYHAALCQRGVTGYALDHCWQDYLRGVAGKVLMTVVATVLFDNASAHKIAWRRADLARLVTFCADHDLGPDTFS
jgi:aminoglycoside phosphotransferase (APT) family kinase protein